jgi:hypothetical protein
MKAALLLAPLALALASCATLKVADTLPEGGPRGYVSFYTGGAGNAPNLLISQVEGGTERAPLRNSDFWNSYYDYRVACEPGTRDFVVRHGTYQGSFSVPVEAGMVTFVSFREQLLDVTVSGNTYGTTTTTTYYVRGSQGTYELPADPKASDPAPFVAALADGDWGTRSEALAALARIRPSLGPADSALVSSMALADPSSPVRRKAAALLGELRLPVPAPALFLESFESNLSNHWATSSGDSYSWNLDAEGYRAISKDENSHWSTIQLPKKLAELSDFDVVLECEWVAGSDSMPFGLTLGPSLKDFHAFMVSKNGGAKAVRFSDSKYLRDGFPWTQEAAAEIAASPVARIEVAKRGASYSVKVDGVSVGSFVDPDALGVGKLGVLIWGKQNVIFRELLVLQPK